MAELVDLVGDRFGRWFVIARAKNRVYPSGGQRTFWLCKCDCGEEREVDAKDLKNGKSTSCFCRTVEVLVKRSVGNAFGKTHGLTNHRLHGIHKDMIARCSRPKLKNYKNYGGKGITVCEEWKCFITFYQWAVSNGYQDNLTIDRIDSNGNYEPSNCRWLTKSENCSRATKERHERNRRMGRSYD